MTGEEMLRNRAIEVIVSCEEISSIWDANGTFKRQLAFDLLDKDLEAMTVGELTGIIKAASDRFSRFYDNCATVDDLEWLEKYSELAERKV